MELKALLLGLLFSLGVFALKSGAGLGYIMRKSTNGRRRSVAVCAFVAAYVLLFVAAGQLLRGYDFLAHTDSVTALLRHGMSVHFVFACALLLWGRALLVQAPDISTHSGSSALLLALPCPVCCSVILFSAALLLNLFPARDYLLLVLALAFILMALASAAVFYLLPVRVPHHLLGAAMVTAATYFLLTIFIVPQCANLSRVYRLAQPVASSSSSYFFYLLALLFLIGIIRGARRTPWK